MSQIFRENAKDLRFDALIERERLYVHVHEGTNTPHYNSTQERRPSLRQEVPDTPGSRSRPLLRLGLDVVEQGRHRRLCVIKDRSIPVFPDPPRREHDYRRSTFAQLAGSGPHRL
jgi:hypothetical protein